MLDYDFLDPGCLRAFVAVAETSSFTRASERLHLTQPTVSLQIRRLEDSVGQTLFRRDPQTVRLTDAGESLLGYARNLLDVMGQARRQFAQPPLEGTVRFGLVEDFANSTPLVEVLGRLRRRHARFELFTETGNSNELFRRLEAGSLDLVLAKRRLGEARGEGLCRQPFVWAGRAELLGLDPQEAVPLVLYPPDSLPREIILDGLRRAGRRWSVRFVSGSYGARRAALLAGLGVTAFGLGMIPADVELLPSGLLPTLEDTECALARNPLSVDKVVVAFGEILRTVAPLLIGRLIEEQTLLIPKDSRASQADSSTVLPPST